MKKVSVLIVEDNALIADSISECLVKNDLDVTAVCGSGEEALDSIRELKPDLILMDVQLAGKLDGISTVEEVNRHYDIPVIYLTDYVDKGTLERAKKTLPAHYLGKPFHDGELVRAIDIAFTNWQAARRKHDVMRDYIFLRDGSSQVKLSCHDIVYIAADRAYCKIVTDKKEYTLANNMGAIFSQMSNSDFMKVHRSYVINVKKVTEFQGNVVCLGRHKVEISKSMKEEVISRFRFLK